jgi:hypothetical protein
MNNWTKLSIEYANQRSYLDDLFLVYPTIPEGLREIDDGLWKSISEAYDRKDNAVLLNNLLKLNLFPIKDSYVAYLRRDKKSMERNPSTVARLCGRLYELGLETIYDRASEPKETNRQIGPLFRRWLKKKALGLDPVGWERFLNTKENAVLDAGDAEMKAFAEKYLGYKHNKGLDLVARFNGKYVIGEAKFLTDFGGHQNSQFRDAVSTIKAKNVDAVKIAILDGVCYIKGNNKMFKEISSLGKYNIMSALVLREFLYQL